MPTPRANAPAEPGELKAVRAIKRPNRPRMKTACISQRASFRLSNTIRPNARPTSRKPMARRSRPSRLTRSRSTLGIHSSFGCDETTMSGRCLEERPGSPKHYHQHTDAEDGGEGPTPGDHVAAGRLEGWRSTAQAQPLRAEEP